MDMLDARAASISTATLILARNCGLSAMLIYGSRALPVHGAVVYRLTG